MTLRIRQRRRVFLGLDEDLHFVAADDGKKRIPVRLLKPCLKTQLVAVERDGLIDVANDEERRNRLRRWSCHKAGASPRLARVENRRYIPSRRVADSR